MALNERFAWALTILEIQPKDKVLEIGCGAGQPPFEITIEAAEPTKNKLKAHSFETIDTILKR